MITKSSKYAIRAVLYLAKNATIEKKIGSKIIAKELEIPAPFLAKTLQELTKNDIISSVKGPNGGFYLTKKNSSKNIFDIIECVDSVNKFEQCFLGQLECDDKNPCVVHHLYAPFKKKLIHKLKTHTILEMAKEHANNNDFINSL